MVELRNIDLIYSSESGEVSAGDKGHGAERSLVNVNLKIEDGSFVLLTGPSGCGKTTILRLINGLIPNYYTGEINGEVLVDGEPVAEKELHETARETGTVFQNPRSQFFNVDTTSELAFSCENAGMDEKIIKERIEETVKRFRIGKLMDRSIFKLSDGEKQKIACASIDVSRPRIILLDEPSANLDYQATMQLKGLIRIWKEQGKTIIAAEHRISYLWDLVDRAVILREGRIVRDLARDEMKNLSDADIASLGLRTVHSEDPAEAALPVISDDDEKIIFRKFYFSYKGGMFDKPEAGREILHIEELKLAAGRVTAVVGANGAGKTTFLQCVCGLEKRCRGTMEYRGRIYGRRERQDIMFMVMQDTNHQLFTESVLEEVLISMPAGFEEEKEAHARELLQKADLLEFSGRHPMSLSGGQKQRLAVACAIASNREILLFDEPTSGLDYAHMEETASLLRELKEMGKTVIVVTHDSELIARCCDRKIVIGQ